NSMSDDARLGGRSAFTETTRDNRCGAVGPHENGVVEDQSDLARRLGVSRARVTQVIEWVGWFQPGDLGYAFSSGAGCGLPPVAGALLPSAIRPRAFFLWG